VFMVVVLAYFTPLVFNQSLLIYWGDELEQLLPHIHQFVHWIQTFDFSFWNPSLGLGSNVFSGFFISMGSPFIWIAALFPIEWLPHLFIFFDMVRFLLIAYFAYLWLSQLLDDELAIWVGSFIITFSGYMMLWIHYAPFIDSFIGFVLVLYLSEELLKGKKPILFSLSIVFTAALNPYYFYMFSWFLVFYLSYRILSEKSNRTLKSFIFKAWSIGRFYILGVGLSAIFMIPVFLILKTTPRVGTLTWRDLMPTTDLKTIYGILTSFVSVVSNDYDYNLFYSYYAPVIELTKPYIYSMVISLIMVIPFLKAKFTGKRAFLIFSISLYAMLFFPIFYKIFNGNTDARWSFMLVFVNALIAGFGLQYRHQMTRTDWIINAVFWSGLMLVIAYISSSHFYVTDTLIGRLKVHVLLFIVLSISYSILFMFKPKKRTVILLGALLILEGTYSLTRRMEVDQQALYIIVNDQFDLDALFYDGDVESILNQDHGFYRIDVEDGITTQPVAQDFPGFLMYSSLYNHTTQLYYTNRFMPFRKLEYAPSKTLAKTILGSKYWITRQAYFPYGYDAVSDTLAINQLQVGLGFASAVKYASQHLLTTHTFIQDVSMYSGIFDPLGSSSYQPLLPITLGEDLINGGVDNTNTENGYYIVDYSQSNPYTTCRVEYSKDGNVFQSLESHEYGYTSFPSSKEATKIYFYCSNTYNESDYTPVDIYLVTHAYIDTLYQNVQTLDTFENVVNQKDFISADITITQSDKTVFTTLAFDSGWEVYVDGKKTSTRMVNGAFVGFDLELGNHHVEFKYMSPGFMIGAILSSLSAILLLLYIFLNKKMKS